MSKSLAEIRQVKAKIYTIRGLKIMIDRDLSQLYGVETKKLNQAVKRNSDRFPDDFIFQLTKHETEEISRSQNVTMKHGQNIKYLPYAFTEQGVAMLSGVLKSKVAIEFNIRIMRAFVEVRNIIAARSEYKDLRQMVEKIESRVSVIESNNMVDGAILERKITAMNSDIRRVSNALDEFQDAHIVIKRPEDEIKNG